MEEETRGQKVSEGRKIRLIGLFFLKMRKVSKASQCYMTDMTDMRRKGQVMMFESVVLSLSMETRFTKRWADNDDF